MGWKNVKEHYRIDHQVQVTNEGICIGSPYIHAIIVISLDGTLVKEDDRTLNDKLSRYQAEMKADPGKLRDLVLSEDKFSSSIPVYTYDGATIVPKFCEELGWPNVTHDGAMMYDNTFFADREAAVEAAKRNCEAAILLRRSEIAGLRSSIASSSDRLDELLSQAKDLGLSNIPEIVNHQDQARNIPDWQPARRKLLEISQRLIKWDTDFPVNCWNGYAGLKELDKIIADAKVAVHQAGASYEDEFGTNHPLEKEGNSDGR
ncbi:hypothetical protein MRBLRH8O_001706 [Agrobacterium radiobacter]|uniref:hypothetical protein n=1 Tax=Agrobacterium radiobacter TaxID=362 RepID=UPI0034670A46